MEGPETPTLLSNVARSFARYPNDEMFIERSLITGKGLLSRLLRLGLRYESKHRGNVREPSMLRMV